MKRLTFLYFLLISFLGIAQDLKLMTYNIRLDVPSDGENSWANRKDFFTAQVKFYEPDVFGIQEATPNQVINISKELTLYNQVGIGREGIGKGESSNIYFKKDRFKVIDEKTFWLSETPEQISKGWDAAFNRVCTYVLLKDTKKNIHFWVFNTHLDHVGIIARTKGIALILAQIEKVNTKNYPVFFMGDFNSEPTEERIISLKTKMNDSRESSKLKPFGPYGTFNAFKHNEPVTILIDYIFISKKSTIKVNKYAVLSDAIDLRYPSDHLPVYVELNYK